MLFGAVIEVNAAEDLGAFDDGVATLAVYPRARSIPYAQPELLSYAPVILGSRLYTQTMSVTRRQDRPFLSRFIDPIVNYLFAIMRTVLRNESIVNNATRNSYRFENFSVSIGNSAAIAANILAGNLQSFGQTSRINARYSVVYQEALIAQKNRIVSRYTRLDTTEPS